MYQIEKLVVGMYQANCYAITSGEGTIVIDPGAEATRLLQWLAPKNVIGIIATHCHSDHIGAINELVDATGAWVACGADDVAGMADPHRSGFDLEGSSYVVTHCEKVLHDGDTLKFGDAEFEIIHTPGHTPGSICLWDRENNVLFSGDMLFFRGIGSTEFVLGDEQEMMKSCDRMAKLPDGITVYPGHGPLTRTEMERQMLRAYASRMHSAWREG
ncbi:MAG: MBL fold metallo-hydrolase [Arcanobacterium sp.]|nr:MBL fold metallo-hydrolase [Arcanobacterium sp.]